MKYQNHIYIYNMEIFTLSYATKSLWSDFSKQRFNLFKTDDEFINLGPGDCIIWEGRHDYVVITDVLGEESKEGPRGFIYLPWRNEGRWASRAYSFRGDPRFVICYPEGFTHYGLHIPLHTIKKDDVPELNRKSIYSRLYRYSIIPLRFAICQGCSNEDLTCTIVNEHTYHAKNDMVHIELCIFKLDEYYLVDINKISGCEVTFQDFVLDFNLTEYPL